MGLFKEFKDDFSQAVNELVPGDVPEKEVEPKAQTADNLVVDTIGENVDVASELSKLDGLLEHVEEQPQETTVPRPTPSENFAEHTIKKIAEAQCQKKKMDIRKTIEEKLIKPFPPSIVCYNLVE